jgi:oligosaccharide repeat unit polymerase
MVLLVGIGLFALAIACYRIGRSWLFPPALYAVVWSMVMFVAFLTQYKGYTLSEEAALIFIAGVTSFVFGGFVVTLYFGNKVQTVSVPLRREKYIKTFIMVYSVGLWSLIPAFIIAVNEAGQTVGIDQFALAARYTLGQVDRTGIPRFYQSLTSIGSVLAFCAAWLYNGSRRDKILLGLGVGAPLTMSVLTFSRSPVYALLIGVLAILAFRKTVKSSTLAIGALIVLIITMSMGAFLGKTPGLFDTQGSSTEVMDSLLVYYIGGPLAFSEVLASPSTVGEQQLSLRFFTQAFQSFGAEITLPDNVLAYVTEDLGNVYTMYFAYWLDWGWLGVIGVSVLAGIVCTGVYMLARRNLPFGGVSLSLVISSIINTPVGDGLFGSVVPWLLIGALTWVLWYLPLPFLSTSRRFDIDSNPAQTPKTGHHI